MHSSSTAIEPVQLTFLTTNTCTAKCDHCSVHSSPKRKGSLSAAQMIDAIEGVDRAGRLRVVIFAGGEPTLLGEALLDVIAHADGKGLITRLITNAHWATSERNARDRLVELREAGLREINISCDDYHTPFIPIRRVKHAWEASRGLGFDAVVIASASGPRSRLTPEKIQQLLGEEVPLVFDDAGYGANNFPVVDGSIRIISNANIARIGRGTDRVAADDLKYPRRQQMLDLPCMWIRRSPAVSPTNHLLSCCGMEASGKRHLDYGELGTNEPTTLFATAQKDPVVRALATLGPYRLMKMLKQLEPSVDFRDRYSGVCEVCAHIFERDDVVALLTKHAHTISILVDAAETRH